MPSSQTPPAGSTALDPTAIRPAIDDARIIRTSPAALRDELIALRGAGYAMLSDVGGVDYLAREPRFDVVYHLLKLELNGARAHRVRVLCGVPGVEPVVPTVSDLWPSADWAEREVYDLFGISFSGHPDLRRIQMPAEWEGHPLRKDYPLRGPARERTPRPSFALKSNVAAGTPAAGKTAAALQRQIAAARGQATVGSAAADELAAEPNAARGAQLPKDGSK
jgi:NADH-quinone oxidoreductase subunit C